MTARTHKIGLDANAPIHESGALAARLTDPDIIAGTGAAWVRINFILGPWSGPGDPAPHNQGRNWQQTYQAIIDQYVERGLNIYGLIGHESVKSSVGLPNYFRQHRDQTADRASAERWIADYVTNFAEIVKLFRDKVQVFESFNEPDDWHGQQQAWIHPTWYAVMLTEIYRRLKVEGGAQVKLISGPLQGLEVNRNDAPTRYLRDAYQYGRERLGWGRDIAYPFDGVGYHLYIKEGFNPNWPVQEREVRQTYRQYVDGMLQVIRTFEGTNSNKKLYVSEIGWHSNADTLEAKNFQAQNLLLALDLLVNDPAVAVGIWFCTEDFAPGSKFYGLYQMGQPNPQGRKPAYEAYKTFCQRLLAAQPTPETPPKPEPVPEQPKPEPVPTQPPAPPGTPAPGPRKTVIEEITELKQQVAELQRRLQQLPVPTTPSADPAAMAALSQQVAQIQNQNADFQKLIDWLQHQLQQIAEKQSQLQTQLQQLEARAGSVPASGLTSPPPPTGPAARPAPLIQNIIQQLKHHPTLRFESRPRSQIRRIIIHHTAIPANIGADKIAAYGVDSKGWPGIRYHYFITGEGQIQQTNELTTLTTQAGPYSADSIGIGFAGDFTAATPTAAQLEAGAQLIAWLLGQLNLSIGAVVGFKELVNTQSPGLQWDSGARWGDQLKARIQAYL